MKRLLATLALAGLMAPVTAAEPIRIGVVNEISGPQAEAGRFTLNGIRLALDEVNKAGGVLGRSLELRVEAASRLSIEIDQRGGPTDLRCIFRGMSEETGKQLDAAAKATTGGDQAKAYARLMHMLKDAVEIAPAVGGNATAASASRAAAAQCPASKDF